MNVLSKMNKEEITKPERHKKGWGYEDWIVNNEKYCGKILHFEKGKKFSVHYHKIKDETFYVLKGKFEAIFAENPEEYEKGITKKMLLQEGDVVHIWQGRVHQLIALEEGDIIEFSTQHFEDDSYRIVKGD